MRTKVILGLAALAVGLSTSVAQNVYSLNVVGYVNQTVQKNHWYLWGNPLKGTNNTAAAVLSGLNGNPDDWTGAVVWPFSGGTYGGSETWVGAGLNTWLPGTTDLAPGKGFWFFAPTNGTVTFVGEVVTTNTFALAPGWSIVASAFPATNSLVSIGLTGSPGTGLDTVYRYNNGYGAAETFVTGLGWLGSADSNGPVLNVGEAVWYNNANAAVNWVKTFTIN